MTIDLGTRHLRLEREGHIATLTIDRPDSRNALSRAMYFGIKRALTFLNGLAEPTALVITGVGDVFAPGGELRGREDDAYEALDVLTGIDILPFEAVRQSRQPVVSAVNGICQGGGLLIAMLSDVAVVSERATFRAPELLRGIADMGYAAYLPPQIGIARARDLLLTGRRLDAKEAVEFGLVSRVVPHGELMAAARAVAEDILRTGPEARLAVKRAVNGGYGLVDTMTFFASIAGAEAKEGMTAFAEKRSPSWIPKAITTGSRV
jgi:enoyl-CoA hydratase/carnithine racemase